MREASDKAGTSVEASAQPSAAPPGTHPGTSSASGAAAAAATVQPSAGSSRAQEGVGAALPAPNGSKYRPVLPAAAAVAAAHAC
jgi:hypothetical protein